MIIITENSLLDLILEWPLIDKAGMKLIRPGQARPVRKQVEEEETNFSPSLGKVKVSFNWPGKTGVM